jgi:hypothetical protein
MNEILFSNPVIVYLLSELILFVLLLIAFIISIRVLIHWDFESFSPLQFKLEQQAYLVTTITLFVFSMKFLLLLYFAFTVDSLASLIAGAMCSAGVIDANEYGSPLLALKLLILFGLTLWIWVNFYDLRTKNYQWFKEKSWIFMVMFIFITIELLLDFTYFTHIDTHQPVSCCSALFGQLEGANPLPFGLNISTLLILFYLLFALVILTLLTHQSLLYIVANILFLYIAYFAVVYFFGTYIYELPTHKCPFCMLQKEYHYVGYLLWISLFLGSYIGINSAITALWLKEENQASIKIVMSLLSFFVLLCSTYVAVYYLKNGVLL